MRTILLLSAVLLPWSVFAADPIARVAVEEDGQIVPGQQVHLLVDVLVPDFFTSPPDLPLFEIPNALVTLSGERAQNLVQTIDGVEYSGIRNRYSLVPENDGTFQIPPIDIGVSYSEDGVPKKATVATTPVSFTVGAVENAGGGPPFAARNLSINQEFDRDPSAMRVGDAIIRTVTVFAEDVQAMTMPPVELADAPGLRTYRKDPKLEDNVSVGRGETGSRRIETVVYVAEKEGDFEISAINYPWFDVDGHVATSASLSATKVHVDPKASATAIEPVVDEVSTKETDLRPYVIWLLATVSAVALACVAAFVTRRRFRHRAPRPPSERRQLLELRAIILHGSEPEVYAALARWSRRKGFRTVDEWAAAGDDCLRRQTEVLSRRLFKSEEDRLDRKVLAQSVATVTHGVRAAPTIGALPQLNPGAPIDLRRKT